MQPKSAAAGGQIRSGVKKLAIDAEVVWRMLDERNRAIGVGVEFAALSAEQQQSIQSIIAERCAFVFERKAPTPPPLPAEART